MDDVTAALIAAEQKADDLFRDVVARGLIRAGASETALNDAIRDLAAERHGVKRHWHRRVVRSGPNTVCTYYDNPPDRTISADDIVYLDFGPVFGAWEADYGRSYVLGDDPDKHRLVADIDAAFQAGKARFEAAPSLSCGSLYDFVCAYGAEAGWDFGAPTAGHLIGPFPHETAPGKSTRFSIRHGNEQDLREPDAAGRRRHWILEIHFIDRARRYGAFMEQLLTT